MPNVIRQTSILIAQENQTRAAPSDYGHEALNGKQFLDIDGSHSMFLLCYIIRVSRKKKTLVDELVSTSPTSLFVSHDEPWNRVTFGSVLQASNLFAHSSDGLA